MGHQAVPDAEGALVRRYGVMCIPGHAEDGSDSAWFVVPEGRYFRPRAAIYVGDGDHAWSRAWSQARRLNRSPRKKKS